MLPLGGAVPRVYNAVSDQVANLVSPQQICMFWKLGPWLLGLMAQSWGRDGVHVREQPEREEPSFHTKFCRAFSGEAFGF